MLTVVVPRVNGLFRHAPLGITFNEACRLRRHANQNRGYDMNDFGTVEQELVRNLVRKVDKQLEHQAKLAPDGEHVLLSLKRGKLKGEVRLPIASLREATDSLANMEAVRQRIKRARDGMVATMGQVPIQKNGIERSQPSEGSFFFRSNNRPGGGGGRR